jgi:hypothetical protein
VIRVYVRECFGQNTAFGIGGHRTKNLMRGSVIV